MRNSCLNSCGWGRIMTGLIALTVIVFLSLDIEISFLPNFEGDTSSIENKLDTTSEYTHAYLNETIVDNDVEIYNRYGFHPSWHPAKRSERYPSFEERLKIYMGNWYLPPCNNENRIEDERIRYHFNYTTSLEFPSVELSFINRNSSLMRSSLTLSTLPNKANLITVWEKALWKEGKRREGHEICLNLTVGNEYCDDMRSVVIMTTRMKDVEEMSQIPPVFFVTGDVIGNKATERLGIPSLQKVRYASTKESLSFVTSPRTGLNCSIHALRSKLGIPLESRRRKKDELRYQGIIWPITMNRHFNPDVLKRIMSIDIPWEEKQYKAVWRGSLTGHSTMTKKERPEDVDGVCNTIPRCQLVMKYWNTMSKYIDVGITSGKNNILNEFDQWKYMQKAFIKVGLNYEQQLQNKAIIIFEGNDVATGLKWALLSRSVVIMPNPTITSYAMEEWLQPWKHYIPLEKSDLSDLEEKVKWIEDNDHEARLIAERSTLYMRDFLFHEDSYRENVRLMKKVLRKYFQFFSEK